MKQFIISLSVLVLLMSACKSKSSQASSNSTEQASLIVSFYSIGSGPDNQARRSYFDYQEAFEKQYHVKIPTTRHSWGKEGESDYNLDLSKLDKKQRSKFISGLKKELEGKQVHVKDAPIEEKK